MNKGINFASSELKETLVQKINESGVPAVNVRGILCELLQQVTDAEKRLIAQERAEYEAAVKAEADAKKEGSKDGKH